jgi:hypothetical protein
MSWVVAYCSEYAPSGRLSPRVLTRSLGTTVDPSVALPSKLRRIVATGGTSRSAEAQLRISMGREPRRPVRV